MVISKRELRFEYKRGMGWYMILYRSNKIITIEEVSEISQCKIPLCCGRLLDREEFKHIKFIDNYFY